MMKANDFAITLKDLHQPGTPLVLPNVWDLTSLTAVLSLNTGDEKLVKAIATASWAIAAALGIKDEDLTLEQNLEAIGRIAPHVQAAGLPLTVDLQDGYGARIGEVVAAAVNLGAHGANIEDSIPSAGFGAGIQGSLYDVTDQIARLRQATAAASDAGCPAFVINARCDVFRLEPGVSDGDATAMAEAVRRGKAYLDAGATTVFYWGGKRGLSRGEVESLVNELSGRVAVKLSDSTGPNPALTVDELADVGVARISIGPSLYLIAVKSITEAARRIILGGRLGA